MNAAFLPLAWLAVLAPPLETVETPTTRLFVRTVPPGARIILDGKPLGRSNGLFLVSPGVQKITVELEGYYPEGQQVKVPEGWITRVELELRRRSDSRSRRPAGSQQAGSLEEKELKARSDPASARRADSDAASKAAAARLGQADIAGPVREAMLTVLRQHPSQTRWSGRSGSKMFAVAAKSLPGGEIRQRTVPALLELSHMLAVQELLTAKSLLDRYAATGLTDATTLRQAVEEAAGMLHVTGEVKGLTCEAAVHGEFGVAYVIADEASLTAYLLQPPELEKVQTAYRDVMHEQARELMERHEWKEALLLWQHLHQRKLVSQQLYLDAARCFKELGQQGDTIRVLSEAIAAFGQSASLGFLEEAGDMALEIESQPAQALAEKAYQMAIDSLRETISQPEPQAQDRPLPKSEPTLTP